MYLIERILAQVVGPSCALYQKKVCFLNLTKSLCTTRKGVVFELVHTDFNQILACLLPGKAQGRARQAKSLNALNMNLAELKVYLHIEAKADKRAFWADSNLIPTCSHWALFKQLPKIYF